MPCGEFSNTKLHRQQISVCIITQLFTIHDKAENLKIQHIISYLFVSTATYFLSTVTFDSIHCPAECLDWNLWEGHENTYLSNIYIHAQDGKNFREFSLKIKNIFPLNIILFCEFTKKHVFQRHVMYTYMYSVEKCVFGIQIDNIKNISMTLILYQNKNAIKDVKRF